MDSPSTETQTMRIEDYEEAPLLFLEPVHAWFFLQKKSTRGNRERNMILAATGNRYRLEHVEQAMKIQCPDDETRHHDDRTGKNHYNILGGVVDEEENHVSGDEEDLESDEEDLDQLATAHEEAGALALLATANRTLRETPRKKRISYGCHVVIIFSNRFSVTVPTGDRNESASSATLQSVLEQSWKPSEKKGEATDHTAYSEFAMAVHMFAREALKTGKALIDCGATRSMGS